MESPAVEVVDLVQRYGRTTAVDGVTFTLPRGEVLALLGPNGAGKTTTVETCEGYRRPDAGRVRVLGLDPIAQHTDLMPRIGVMLQSGGVYPGARAGEALALVASFAARPLDTAMLTERLGLGPVARTPYRRLSGGEKQRLSLAMALVGRLLTTHFLDEAEHLADRVVIVDSGRVVAAGTPAELTAAGEDEQLRFTAPPHLPLGELLTALPEGLSASEPRPGEYVLGGRITPEVLAGVTAWCATHGALVDDLRIGRRTLEDVFLDLTGRELRS
jgi:ABC-2 type transport system ATP-binding protein